jgi:putative translation initiation factor eIF-6
MELSKLDINNTPHIGIYIALGKDKAIIPELVSNNEIKVIKDVLDVECIKYNVAESNMNGILSRIYNNKIILSKISDERDVDFFKSIGMEALVLDSYFAIGNLIATNHKAVLLSKELDTKATKKITDFLDVYAEKFSIGDLKAIGSSIVVNKRGFAVNPIAETKDIKKLEKLFGVKGNIATINYGDTFIANGMLVNDNGILVGKKTTGYELIRIDDIFHDN